MKKIDIPVTVTGPGSQPADEEISFMNLPSGMNIFSFPRVPEPEDIDGMEEALALARKIRLALQAYQPGETPCVFELGALDTKNREFMDQLLGDGEVSIRFDGAISAHSQESVLAGLWRIHYLDNQGRLLRDTMEVADIPGIVTELTFQQAAANVEIGKLVIPESVYNAPPLLSEISDKLKTRQDDDPPHIINLSLLPHTEEDITFLSDSLGIGPVVILSRGYGNCRISSTAVRNVWWVQYFNSQDTLILNTLEISSVPEVAIAAREDIEDSATRLHDILSIYEP